MLNTDTIPLLSDTYVPYKLQDCKIIHFPDTLHYLYIAHTPVQEIIPRLTTYATNVHRIRNRTFDKDPSFLQVNKAITFSGD